MMRPSRYRSLLCVLALGVGLSGCAPSYRRGELTKAIQDICATDYHYTVSARQVGQTIAIHLHHEGILHQEGSQISLAPSANEIIGNLLEAVHRVTLSSETSINFYLLLVSDPKVPGAYLTLVRYMDDVRRANANMIPPTELFLRTILELKYLGTPKMSLDQVILNDIQLGQFLSWQLAKRLQTHLSEQLQTHGMPVAEVGPCMGEFQNGEFAFTLNVTPISGLQLSDAQVQQIFQDATSVVAQVLSGYKFKDFEAVRLIMPSTGRNLLLPKTRLELFR